VKRAHFFSLILNTLRCVVVKMYDFKYLLNICYLIRDNRPKTEREIEERKRVCVRIMYKTKFSVPHCQTVSELSLRSSRLQQCVSFVDNYLHFRGTCCPPPPTGLKVQNMGAVASTKNL
jgi:hypothetical protein